MKTTLLLLAFLMTGALMTNATEAQTPGYPYYDCNISVGGDTGVYYLTGDGYTQSDARQALFNECYYQYGLNEQDCRNYEGQAYCNLEDGLTAQLSK